MTDHAVLAAVNVVAALLMLATAAVMAPSGPVPAVTTTLLGMLFAALAVFQYLAWRRGGDDA